MYMYRMITQRITSPLGHYRGIVSLASIYIVYITSNAQPVASTVRSVRIAGWTTVMQASCSLSAGLYYDTQIHGVLDRTGY